MNTLAVIQRYTDSPAPAVIARLSRLDAYWRLPDHTPGSIGDMLADEIGGYYEITTHPSDGLAPEQVRDAARKSLITIGLLALTIEGHNDGQPLEWDELVDDAICEIVGRKES